MTKTPTLLALMVTALIGTGLVACTDSSSAVDPTPVTTVAATPGTAPPTDDPVDDTCVDGFAWMTFRDGQPDTKELPGGCDTVVVEGSDATLTLGPTRVVVIMGDRNTVDTAHLEQVDAMGDDNTVRFEDDTHPLLNTDGTGNVVTSR